MAREVYRYVIAAEVPLADAEASLVLAIFGAEALHGEAQVRLDAAHLFDMESRTCVIDGSTAVGRDVARLFTGYLRRGYGERCFTVRRLEELRVPAAEAAPVLREG